MQVAEDAFALAGDGSVRLLDETLDAAILAALVSRAGGERP